MEDKILKTVSGVEATIDVVEKHGTTLYCVTPEECIDLSSECPLRVYDWDKKSEVDLYCKLYFEVDVKLKSDVDLTDCVFDWDWDDSDDCDVESDCYLMNYYGYVEDEIFSYDICGGFSFYDEDNECIPEHAEALNTVYTMACRTVLEKAHVLPLYSDEVLPNKSDDEVYVMSLWGFEIFSKKNKNIGDE